MASSKRKKTSSRKTDDPDHRSRGGTTSEDPGDAADEAESWESESDDDVPSDLTPAGDVDEGTSSEVLVGELVEEDEWEYGDSGEAADVEPWPTGAGDGGDMHHQLIKRDPLSAYIQETKRFPLMSREEETELAIRYREHGDTAAARRLIESNLRLVVKIAYEYRRAHRNLLDLIQEGNIGLMQGVKKYDPYRGVKLSSYAAWWIRAYILKFVLNNWRLVKIGTTQAQRKLFFNLRKEKERLQQLGFQPTTALLAENLDVNEKEVIEMEQRMAAPDASLDAPLVVDEDGMPRSHIDMLAGEEELRPDLQVAQGEVQDLLQAKLEEFGETLEGRDATIFRERLLSHSPLTLQDIGDRYHISRERARQLEKRLLRKLRDFLEDEIGTAVDIEAMINE